MTNMSDQKKWLTDLFSNYEDKLNGQSNHPIVSFRKSAFEAFQSADIPTRRDEDWKYTSVAKIFNNSLVHGDKVEITQSDIASHLFSDLEVTQIVYVNGRLVESLSSIGNIHEGFGITKLSTALQNKTSNNWIQDLNKVNGGTDVNAFLSLNRAFANEGLVIAAEKNITIEKPVHILHINLNSENEYFTSPQLYIHGKPSSSFTVIESHIGSTDTKYFSNIVNRVDVEDNARVTHYKIQQEGTSALQISNTIARQGRDSVFTSYVVDIGGSMIRNNLSTDLLDQGTVTNYFGVYIGDNSQHIDNQTFIDHAVPHCDSNELYKGILTGKARGVFNGKVMVREDAQKTNAFQQNSSLVLSPTAIMDAKPQLEIYADDVKCSHGATIGQLDENSIFYLKSRGISEQNAKSLLQKAFVGEVVMHVKIPQVRDAILDMIDMKLSK